MTQSVVYIAASTPSDFERHDQASDVNNLGTSTSYNGDSYELVSIAKNTDDAKRIAMSSGISKMLAEEYGVTEANHSQNQADLVNAINWMQTPGENKFYIPVKKADAQWFLECFSNVIGGDTTVNDLEKYDDKYYKVVLDFTNDFTNGSANKPSDGELADLKRFKERIETRSTDTKEIGETFGPDMLTLYTFAKETLATQDKIAAAEAARARAAAAAAATSGATKTEAATPTRTPGLQKDTLKAQSIFTDEPNAATEIPNELLGWLPQAEQLMIAMGEDEYKRFIGDDIDTIGYGVYDDSWFSGDDTGVVTHDELLELAGESYDIGLDWHFDDAKEKTINAAARDLISYLQTNCSLINFSYTMTDFTNFHVVVLKEKNGNLTATIAGENGRVCVVNIVTTSVAKVVEVDDPGLHVTSVDTNFNVEIYDGTGKSIDTSDDFDYFLPIINEIRNL